MEMIFNPHFDHLSYQGSASAIRPLKMKKAFQECGLTVLSVEGSFGVRQKISKDLIQKIKGGYRPAFIYCESATSPHNIDPDPHLPKHSFELELARTCREHGVPTAIFYRDIHWTLVKKEKLRDRLIQIYYKPFFRWEWKEYLRTYQKIYLPSNKMKEYLPSDPGNVGVLMPGGDLLLNDHSHGDQFSGVHVGGITSGKGLYDMSPVLRAFRDSNVPLHLICRASEWHENKSYYSSLITNTLTVSHEVDDDMRSRVQQASVGLLIYPHHLYRSFAFPFKVMEYLFLGLPLMVSSGTPVAAFVKEKNVGWVINSESELTDLLVQLKNDKVALQNKRENISKILPQNTWKARAQQVINEMTSV